MLYRNEKLRRKSDRSGKLTRVVSDKVQQSLLIDPTSKSRLTVTKVDEDPEVHQCIVKGRIKNTEDKSDDANNDMKKRDEHNMNRKRVADNELGNLDIDSGFGQDDEGQRMGKQNYECNEYGLEPRDNVSVIGKRDVNYETGNGDENNVAVKGEQNYEIEKREEEHENGGLNNDHGKEEWNEISTMMKKDHECEMVKQNERRSPCKLDSVEISLVTLANKDEEYHIAKLDEDSSIGKWHEYSAAGKENEGHEKDNWDKYSKIGKMDKNSGIRKEDKNYEMQKLNEHNGTPKWNTYSAKDRRDKDCGILRPNNYIGMQNLIEKSMTAEVEKWAAMGKRDRNCGIPRQEKDHGMRNLNEKSMIVGDKWAAMEKRDRNSGIPRQEKDHGMRNLGEKSMIVGDKWAAMGRRDKNFRNEKWDKYSAITKRDKICGIGRLNKDHEKQRLDDNKRNEMCKKYSAIEICEDDCRKQKWNKYPEQERNKICRIGRKEKGHGVFMLDKNSAVVRYDKYTAMGKEDNKIKYDIERRYGDYGACKVAAITSEPGYSANQKTAKPIKSGKKKQTFKFLSCFGCK